MELNVIDAHIVVHWPLLKRYTVFFREGGVQNFITEIDELPPTLQKYVKECEDNQWFEVREFGFVPNYKPDLSTQRSTQPFSMVLYSKSYGNLSTPKKE